MFDFFRNRENLIKAFIIGLIVITLLIVFDTFFTPWIVNGTNPFQQSSHRVFKNTYSQIGLECSSHRIRLNELLDDYSIDPAKISNDSWKNEMLSELSGMETSCCTFDDVTDVPAWYKTALAYGSQGADEYSEAVEIIRKAIEQQDGRKINDAIEHINSGNSYMDKAWEALNEIPF